MLMQGETLAALGESLRREFQEIFNIPLPSLAELTNDDLLNALDDQLQTLALWLTSATLSITPPQVLMQDETAEESVPRSVLQPPMHPPSGAQAHNQVTVGTVQNREASKIGPSGQQVSSNAPSAQVERAPQPSTQTRFQPPAESSSGLSEQNSSSTFSEETSPPVESSVQLPVSRPSESPVLYAQPAGEQRLAPVPAVAPRVPSRSTTGEAAPPKVVEPQGQPTRESERNRPAFSPAGFTATRNLHDLARRLTSSDGAPFSERDFNATVPVADESASAPTPEALNPIDAARGVEMPHNAAPTPHEAVREQPSPVRIYDVVPSTPTTVTSVSAANLSPETPSQASEIDIESLLDALARSVAEDYQRFYGS
jgi:hypothetical protein